MIMEKMGGIIKVICDVCRNKIKVDINKFEKWEYSRFAKLKEGEVIECDCGNKHTWEKPLIYWYKEHRETPEGIYPEEQMSDGIRCPNCKSSNVNQIGTLERGLSVATLGLFSSKIGKTYSCKKCGYKW